MNEATIKENELKERLLEIKNNEWKIPEGLDYYQFTLELMGYIGSTDPVLRDELVLSVLWTLITEDKLAKEELESLLELCLSEKHLYKGLGLKEDDSVFNRAFTVLIVGVIVRYHNSVEGGVLPEAIMAKAFDSVTQYVRQENDPRGFVDEKGWAHAIAHSSDALKTLALCDFMKEKHLNEVLNLVREKMTIGYHAFDCEEAERMAVVVNNVVDRKILSEATISEWVRSLETYNKPEEYPEAMAWRENTKDLLRSVYFRLKFKSGPESIIQSIEEVLNKLNERMYNYPAE